MASLPLHDAILIENGVVTRINRIARAIEYTPDLASQYESQGLSMDLIARAEAGGKSRRAATKARGPSPFKRGPGEKYSFGAAQKKLVRVRAGARRAIAAALGVLAAYDRGVARKRMQSSKLVSGSYGKYDEARKSIIGAKRTMESRDARLARVAAERAAMGFEAGKGYHVGSDLAFDYAKAALRAKYPGKDKPAAYYEELKALRATRRAEAKGSEKAFGRVGPKALRAQRAAAKKGAAKVAANPFSDVGDLALTNPSTGIGFLDSIEDSVSGIPVVGSYAAPLVAPALLGAAAAGLHAVAVPKLKEYLPEAIKPYAYSAAGVAVAVAAGFIANSAKDESTKNLAGLIGGMALAFGVGHDVNEALERRMGSDEGAKAGVDDFAGLALGSHDDDGDFGAVALGESALGAVALGESALGDGMAYSMSPLGFDGETNALHAEYAEASLADAYYSGPDFDADEGEAVLAGPTAFKRRAGAPPRRATGPRSPMSHMAGRPYHRWGWMIKQIGFPAMQQVAALPPEQRLKVINQLRTQALAWVQQAVDASRVEAAASAPVVAPAELTAQGAQGAMAGYDMNGYGALLLAGGGY